MSRDGRGAGAYEQQRYQEGLRAWRRRSLPRLPWLTLPILVGSLVYLLIGPPTKLQYLAGLFGGAMFAVYIWARDEPQAHVQHHREGAEGERATEKVLRPLVREGWRAAHNVETVRGNRDHVIVGPGGLFLLDSKKLGGAITVTADTVHVARVDDPRDSYDLPRLAPALRGEAATLHDEILAAANVNVWTSAVVVFWSRFDGRVVDGNNITFVHGDELAAWLRSRPRKLSEEMIVKIAERIA